ncbi:MULTISPECIES: TetR/AcrR family transcriptional regulator [Trichocoleus]|uniref:TetR/AcrR family transcriptional regulator n=1 Tax=Trichocoleus desertorum GB2-A4 TaxID=2933944 RepID=A0ABV0JGM9_9CYAN|nr:TetR/AcrR family transcriptional regulator [Trichocoleus sp. FACHB-46]MBD1865642.1 TetR family transcriptional regulator [Trichocoleus sp. FACHB-46]
MVDERPKASTLRRQPQQARSQERVHHILDMAEQLFIELGYDQVTTRAIATRSEVPVGSLYQFFPDKAAILRALANRYFEQEYRLLMQLHAELAESEIALYIDRMIDTMEHFAAEHPGYRAVLGPWLKLMSTADAEEMNEPDPLLLPGLANFLSQRNPELDSTRCELVASIVLKTTYELLWLASTRDRLQQPALVAETKTLITAYLQSYKI